MLTFDNVVWPYCRGKAFEDHHSHETVSPDVWRCKLCGDRGSHSDFARRLAPVMVTLESLRAQLLDKGAVILMPSPSPAKELGTIWGYYQLIRTGGISAPMVAVPGAAVLGGQPVRPLNLDQLR